jgi:hypothetical protein
VADALALSTVADLEKVGITGAAASDIAAFFGNVRAGRVEPETELEPDEPVPEPDASEPQPEPEPETPSGPMVEFDEAAVQSWLGTVPGLTPAQRADAAEMMAEDEYNGPQVRKLLDFWANLG